MKKKNKDLAFLGGRYLVGPNRYTYIYYTYSNFLPTRSVCLVNLKNRSIRWTSLAKANSIIAEEKIDRIVMPFRVWNRFRKTKDVESVETMLKFKIKVTEPHMVTVNSLTGL